MCFKLSLFSELNISQGSVATHFMREEIFNNDFIANLLGNMLVK